MYQLGLNRRFIAQHFLIGGDWGRENKLHSHHYRMELILSGPTLNQHGYLADICHVNDVVDALMSRFADRTLNELAEFDALNPSLEHFARILMTQFASQSKLEGIEHVELKLWEDEEAWAATRMPLR